ncbi:MAG: hypothetical protein Q9227_001041 [Pyrenula ochraceoflavens]
MSETRLDQIVKGAPSPTSKLPAIASNPPPPLPNLSSASATSTEKQAPPSATVDPLFTLPSSPPQIYLNLLILESSLRSQYLDLRSRRRLYSFWGLLLVLWNTVWTYLVFLHPREDGVGLGGSVYWFIEMMENLFLIGGVVFSLLFWGTGTWERGVKWPRRWLYVANRGLRGMNAKIVIVRKSWWREWFGHLSFLFPYSSLFGGSPGAEWHYVEHERTAGHGRHLQHHHDEESAPGGGAAGVGGGSGIIEEDLAPGGDHIKLLLLPKSFSPEFRENWEEYRSEYWDRENERRSLLRTKFRQRRRALAKQQGGWMWWTGLWRAAAAAAQTQTQTQTAKEKALSSEKQHQHYHRERAPLSEKEKEARALQRRSLLRSDSAHSRTSSRSTTPQGLEIEPGNSERPSAMKVRRGSSSASTRRKNKEKGSDRTKMVSPLTRGETATMTSQTLTSGSSDSKSGSGSGTTSGSGSGSRPSTPSEQHQQHQPPPSPGSEVGQGAGIYGRTVPPQSHTHGL